MFCCSFFSYFFFFNDTATTEIYTLSLHDALPIFVGCGDAHRLVAGRRCVEGREVDGDEHRSEEHTSELQSQSNLVCRLLLEKKKKKATHKLLISAHTSQHDETESAIETPSAH